VGAGIAALATVTAALCAVGIAMGVPVWAVWLFASPVGLLIVALVVDALRPSLRPLGPSKLGGPIV